MIIRCSQSIRDVKVCDSKGGSREGYKEREIHVQLAIDERPADNLSAFASLAIIIQQTTQPPGNWY